MLTLPQNGTVLLKRITPKGVPWNGKQTKRTVIMFKGTVVGQSGTLEVFNFHSLIPFCSHCLKWWLGTHTCPREESCCKHYSNKTYTSKIANNKTVPKNDADCTLKDRENKLISRRLAAIKTAPSPTSVARIHDEALSRLSNTEAETLCGHIRSPHPPTWEVSASAQPTQQLSDDEIIARTTPNPTPRQTSPAQVSVHTPSGRIDNDMRDMQQ